jgi:CheY-like chemotaxis protein
MDEEPHDRIFDPFFSTKGPGRGLGLAAVQGIVKSAGGKLAVTSTRGDGSVFEVQFPAAQEASVGHSTPPSGYLPRGDGTILVVDDEPTVRAIARDLLETAGFSVIEASTGGEAVKLYESSHGAIDAVLLDMTMPGISGAEALAEIRAIDDDARVILTSGYDGEDTLAESKDTGGVEFLQKPYAASTLLSKISTVLATPARSR